MRMRMCYNSGMLLLVYIIDTLQPLSTIIHYDLYKLAGSAFSLSPVDNYTHVYYQEGSYVMEDTQITCLYNYFPSSNFNTFLKQAIFS